MKKSIRILVAFCLSVILSVVCITNVSAAKYVEKVVNGKFTTNSSCGFLEPGDLDANGNVNAADTVCMKKILLTNSYGSSYDIVYKATGESVKYADVTGDGKIDIIDFIRLKKNMIQDTVFINNGVMELNGNSAFVDDFISVLGKGAEYEVKCTYKSNDPITIKINGVNDGIVFECDASSDFTTITKTFKTSLKLNSTEGIEFQVIGIGSIKNISVTRINMDNELVENW